MQTLKKNFPLALLTGLACGFTFFFFGPFDIYAGNQAEFRFTFADFGLWAFLTAFAVSLAIFLLLWLTPGKIFSCLFALFFWLVIMGYIQGTFLNVGLNFLRGDTGTGDSHIGFMIFDTILWILALGLFLLGAFLMKKHTILRTIALVALIMVLGMQLAGCISQVGTVFGSGSTSHDTEETTCDEPLSTTAPSEAGTAPSGAPAESDTEAVTSEEEEELYLSTYGMYQVGKKSNIVVLVIDRFDTRYYQEIIQKSPDFFTGMEELNGFTLFPDNITRYSRTYPAACSMITAIDQVDHSGQDFGWTADEYFDYAYAHSPFLSDLQDNGYHIRLYLDPYYGYRTAKPLIGVADNVSGASSYVISDTPKLVGNMFALSAYRYLPQVLKHVVTVTTASFNTTVQYTGDYPAYAANDAEVFQTLKKHGLSFDGNDNSFIYLHLSGSHTPCHMDENGNYKGNATIEEATRGCFRLIAMYINELKRLGVYEDTTILIAGDHPWAMEDNDRLVHEPRLSPVLFKPAHADTSKPLVISSAQVSQDNMHASLIKAANIRTERDYGTSYLEVPEGVNIPRSHKYSVYWQGHYYIVEYKVNGNGFDFQNWQEMPMIPIGYLYK